LHLPGCKFGRGAAATISGHFHKRLHNNNLASAAGTGKHPALNLHSTGTHAIFRTGPQSVVLPREAV